MSKQLAASTVKPPSFRDLSLSEIADSHEIITEEAALAEKPQHGVEDLRDLLVVAERQPGAVSLVDTTRHERVGRVEDVGRAPHSLSFHRDLSDDDRSGAFAYTQSRQGWLSKIDLYGGERVARLRGGFSGRDVAVSADDEYVIAGYYNPNHAVVADADTLEPIECIPARATDPDGREVDSRVSALRDVPGERLFLVTLKDAGTVWLVDYDDESFPVVAEIDVGSVLHDGVFTPDGRRFVLASQGDECLYVVDVAARAVVDEIPCEGPPHPSPGAIDSERGLGFSATVMSSAVTAWDLDTCERVATIDVPGHGMFLNAHPGAEYVWGDVVFDATDEANNSLLYCLDPDDLEVAQVIDTAEWGAGRSLHPEFSRDGEVVYVSLWDAGKLVVLDSATGELVAEIDGFETPTGKFLGARAGSP